MPPVDEAVRDFELRKQDHIRLSLDPQNEAVGKAGFDRIQLIHEALPEIDFDQVSLKTQALNIPVHVPLIVSSMTAGHADAVHLNRRMARVCAKRGWWMGVGSQRRQLFDASAATEWKKIRKEVSNLKLLGNIGLAQVIASTPDSIAELAESVNAVAMIVHLNALQECLQPEGTPQFRGGVKTIERLCKTLPIPVIVKETGCGISVSTFKRLQETGVRAIDVSGYGGTHWGRIEGARSPRGELRGEVAGAFADWGLSTVECLQAAGELSTDQVELWGSGGVRSGVDAAKALALGARMVGIAKPVLQAALAGEEDLDRYMARTELELKIAMFCTGIESPEQFYGRKVWQWHKI